MDFHAERYEPNLSQPSAGEPGSEKEILVPVLLADDDPKVCSALRLLLEEQPDLSVIGDVVDWQSLLAYLRANCMPGGSASYPGLLFLDWELPGFISNEQLVELRSACPGVKVVALSVRPDIHQASLAAGVDDFISKSDPPAQVLSVLRSLVSEKSKTEIRDFD